MTNWQEYFYIKNRSCQTNDDPFADDAYDLCIKGTDEVVASYNDRRYAIKQAKYKFKRITQKLEKILLG